MKSARHGFKPIMLINNVNAICYSERTLGGNSVECTFLGRQGMFKMEFQQLVVLPHCIPQYRHQSFNLRTRYEPVNICKVPVYVCMRSYVYVNKYADSITF